MVKIKVILDVLFLEKGMRLLYCGIRFISEQYNTNEFSAVVNSRSLKILGYGYFLYVTLFL
jgi:hypothetical protein